MDNRRDFLKKCGFMAAALGVAAGATKVTKTEEEYLAEGVLPPGNAASLEPTSTRIATKPPELPGPPPYKFGFTGFRNADDKTDAALHALKSVQQKIDEKKMDWQSCAWNTETTEQSVRRAQQAVNELTALRLDNLRMLQTPIVVPKDDFDVALKQSRAREMDPWDWGTVFKLKWVDFKARPDMDVQEGYFEAKVRPHFSVVFGKREVFRSNVLVSNHLIYDTKLDTEELLERHKESAYRKIVDELQRVIRTQKKETEALTSGIPKFVTNLHISNRNNAYLKPIVA